MAYANPWTGKPVDKISDLLPRPNGNTCDECGSPCIDNCFMCGAPQCCPSCCYDDAQSTRTSTARATGRSMVDKLEACPFCGGEAKRFTIGEDEPNNAGGDVIVCTRCQASSHVEFGRKENLVSYWNRRTPANGEQVERADRFEVVERAISDRLKYAVENEHGQTVSPAQLAGAIINALPLSTPTEDAQERVKVLEEALGRLVTTADQAAYALNSGMMDAAITQARIALGNKETDRHG